ncbi:hypothetical protein TYRP_013633 [Tyrophagus putrescentiae]|nr:hypothetical protein TYRP_013633 [Tyrophagus putrescentiae]
MIDVHPPTPNTQSSVCGDWHQYREEKCIKILNAAHTFDDAVELCRKDGSELLLVTSAAEQDALDGYIFKEKQIADSVWIAAKMNTFSHMFKALDGIELSYTNWATGRPGSSLSRNCVQMSSEAETLGKWMDEPCQKYNRVVCEKKPIWTVAQLQQALLADRRKFSEEIKQLATKVERLEKSNAVAVGFTYIQLPHEQSPDHIWPDFTWKDISASYAGVFFRVSGGAAGAFGSTQEENAPRVDQIETAYWTNCTFNQQTPLAVNGWSQPAKTGYYVGTTGMCTRFHTTSGEVRPKNVAINVWKRTA